jgi:hypothetical protein
MEKILMDSIPLPIEHVVALMLENRSYDHMLGYLSNGHGLAGDEFNLVDPADPTSEKVYVGNKSGNLTVIDPAHDEDDLRNFGRSGPVLECLLWRRSPKHHAAASLARLGPFQKI